MPSKFYKAFVASTFEDLKDHRAHVINTLRKSGIFVDPMEDWTAESNEPKMFSQERLDGCDICVLLVAWRRGYIPKGEKQGITQLEYQAAFDKKMDILVYLLKENAPWPPDFIVDRYKDPDISEWRNSLQEKHGVQFFELEPSSIDIAPAITRWVDKQSRKATTVGDDWIQLVSSLLDLPKDEPETWKVAAALLPHALNAVYKAYWDNHSVRLPKETNDVSEPADMLQPIKTLLSGARKYIEDSKAKYERTCLVMMPFGNKTIEDGSWVDFETIYNEIFRPAIEAACLSAERFDTYGFGIINDNMIRYIEYSRIVLADITGSKGEVLYPLGIRHRARKSGTLIVSKAGSYGYGFDLFTDKFYRYNCATPDMIAKSRDMIKKALSEVLLLDRVDSPSYHVIEATPHS